MARWTIDPDHTVAAFVVRHMVIASVRGQFNGVRGTIDFDPTDVVAARVEVTIDVPGIYTGVAKRDEHLCSPDFFSAAEHGVMSFRSTKVEERGGNRLAVTGDLTIRGVTRPVTLEAEYCGPVKDPFEEGESIGFAATATINRDDFGVSWNVEMGDGGVMVSREVLIFLDGEADRVS
jgi:polyisoprenoid-binding protein YceI